MRVSFPAPGFKKSHSDEWLFFVRDIYAKLSIVFLVVGLESPVGSKTRRFNGSPSRLTARALRLNVEAGALPSLFMAS
ncbi:hypothetical protein SRABI112_00864 [Pseudomonas mediterranea]|nr:hypothetical protein SRABI112_00864 [Pseudomonas mediterranea]